MKKFLAIAFLGVAGYIAGKWYLKHTGNQEKDQAAKDSTINVGQIGAVTNNYGSVDPLALPSVTNTFNPRNGATAIA